MGLAVIAWIPAGELRTGKFLFCNFLLFFWKSRDSLDRLGQR